MMLSAVEHYTEKRVPCDSCPSCVSSFAYEIDDVLGKPTGRHFCRVCADKEARGIHNYEREC